jgi:hypothetical protein
MIAFCVSTSENIVPTCQLYVPAKHTFWSHFPIHIHNGIYTLSYSLFFYWWGGTKSLGTALLDLDFPLDLRSVLRLGIVISLLSVREGF